MDIGSCQKSDERVWTFVWWHRLNKQYCPVKGDISVLCGLWPNHSLVDRYVQVIIFLIVKMIVMLLSETWHVSTIVPALKDHPIGLNIFSQHRWSLVACSFTLNCRTFCRKLVVLPGRWSLMAVVPQDGFFCILISLLYFMFSWSCRTVCV